MADLQVDWRLLTDVLDRGPGTSVQLQERIGASQSAVQKAIQRMQKLGVLTVAGRGARPPGQRFGSTPYVVDVGPRVRLWALRNVKPKAAEDE
jgi:DNA-binding Lrp family transcriptional regulator